jgi:hypothetical protein
MIIGLALRRQTKIFLGASLCLCVLVVKINIAMHDSAKLRSNFERVKKVIQAEEMWERVPDYAREFSPENLENLVKYAYFGGFIDMAQARALLFLGKEEIRSLRTRWYEEIREKGCWLC